MAADPSKARYYLRCGLSELDKRDNPVRECLASVYGQWFVEVGSRLPAELRADWAGISARMTAYEPMGASSHFDMATALMSDAEAESIVEDIVAVMVRLGHDDDGK